MIEQLQQLVSDHPKSVGHLLVRYQSLGKPFLERSELVHEYEQFCISEAPGAQTREIIEPLIKHTQEAVSSDLGLCLAIRRHVADWAYVEIQIDPTTQSGGGRLRQMTLNEYLKLKEKRAVPDQGTGHGIVEIDLTPFERGFPRSSDRHEIGRGGERVSRHLAQTLSADPEAGAQDLFAFLKVHQFRGRQLMLNPTLRDPASLGQNLRLALGQLEGRREGDLWSTVDTDLKPLGFEPGWGADVRRVRQTMGMLSEVLDRPSDQTLARFLECVPMIFSIAIISPHGYFGQEGVLGRPDSGGQIVYILDQARALERELARELYECGLEVEPQIVIVTRLIPEADGTSCDQRLEAVDGTSYTKILRVPFRTEGGEVVGPWISRFKIWPYLERFADDVEHEMRVEMGATPDFIVGNYSDGNLVASLLADRLGVTQCNIAHALEKTKYPGSDVSWRDFERDHHFATQYTADLIAMNSADFIVTSTYHEIAGSDDFVGQYESYRAFTMPGLYRVLGGIDCFDPKFNVVSPGADSDIYFPYFEGHRSREVTDEVQRMIFGPEADDSRGVFSDTSKPILFAMSRLDSVKNMGGLLRWFASSDELMGRCNLLLVGGSADKDSADDEELDEMLQMDRVFAEHDLSSSVRSSSVRSSSVRWLRARLDRSRSGEIYRAVADTGGAFVQPALFEAFGLTVIEAMASGLPTFATCFGGPMEVIEDGVSGFHIDPTEGADAVRIILRFYDKVRESPDYWQSISTQSIARVQERYHWERYASRLLGLSRIYGFWRHVSQLDREAKRRYLEMFFGLMYRPLADGVNSGNAAG